MLYHVTSVQYLLESYLALDYTDYTTTTLQQVPEFVYLPVLESPCCALLLTSSIYLSNQHLLAKAELQVQWIAKPQEKMRPFGVRYS